jgi:2,3,4,5-tetrahydropyridine-2-carboxylate N-succinyltransferase
VHLSGGVGIGGVLEPLQGSPTIIEDDCFIGARSEVVEGVVVGEGSVLSMGVFIGAVHQDRRSRDRRGLHGPGARPFRWWSRAACRRAAPTAARARLCIAPSSSRRVDARTRAKTSINELLRD